MTPTHTPAPKSKRAEEADEFARIFNDEPGPATEAAVAGVKATVAARSAGLDPSPDDEDSDSTDDAQKDKKP